jgi:hypothetical protein
VTREGGVGNIWRTGIGKTLARVLVPASRLWAQPPPPDTSRLELEEVERTRGKLQQLEHEYQRLKTESYERDIENGRQKDTIRSLQQELTNVRGKVVPKFSTLKEVLITPTYLTI